MAAGNLYELIQHEAFRDNENPFEPGVETVQDAGTAIAGILKACLANKKDNEWERQLRTCIVNKITEIKIKDSHNENTRDDRINLFEMAVSTCSLLPTFKDSEEMFLTVWISSTRLTRQQCFERFHQLRKESMHKKTEVLLDTVVKSQTLLKNTIREVLEMKHRVTNPEEKFEKDNVHIERVLVRLGAMHDITRELNALKHSTPHTDEEKTQWHDRLWSLIKNKAIADEINRIEDFLRKNTTHGHENLLLPRMNAWLISIATKRNFPIELWRRLLECKVPTKTSDGTNMTSEEISDKMLDLVWEAANDKKFMQMTNKRKLQETYQQVVKYLTKEAQKRSLDKDSAEPERPVRPRIEN